MGNHELSVKYEIKRNITLVHAIAQCSKIQKSAIWGNLNSRFLKKFPNGVPPNRLAKYDRFIFDII